VPSKPRLDISSIRELARTHVEASTLREVADQIGLSKSALDEFVKGRHPYSKNLLKLAAWKLRQRDAGDAPDIRREDVVAAIALLEQYVGAAGSASVREKRVSEVVKRLARTGERRP
jgi:transcriptional regulator with XRE-family HTH domain